MYEEENIEPEFLKRPRIKPFRTPDHYFDSIEDRVMGSIKHEAKKKTSSGTGKIFQMLKPALGLAASFALVFVLVYYPITYFSQKSIITSENTDTIAREAVDAYSIAISLADENTFIEAIFGDETATSTEMNPDEVLAYLSTEMTDLEIYTEIQN